MLKARSAVGIVLCLIFPVNAAVRGDEAMYVGGSIALLPDKTEGHLDLSDESAATFSAKKHKFVIPYKTVTSLEYGQKAGRRVGVALAVSPIALLSKKRKHYLTVGFVDLQGAKQGAVFEVGKGRIRGVATTLESRSGKKLEFESDEARRHFEEK
ncbi:MAG: hypothetical protein ACKV22_19690 [Bryobacteraceae bacterium]